MVSIKKRAEAQNSSKGVYHALSSKNVPKKVKTSFPENGRCQKSQQSHQNSKAWRLASMRCASPQKGWRKVYKRGSIRGIFIKEPCSRPCGQCWMCRLELARQWATRCHHEAQLHEHNSFITLTYNNQHLPKDKSVHKRELQLFFKRLRKHIHPQEVRYYACGEYGTKLGRPHYHACLFGYDFPDKTILKPARLRISQNHFKAPNDFTLYTSKTLEKLWGKGFVTIGEVTFESAGYVARYIMKKWKGKKEEISKYYGDKAPEFALMSRRPGIGKEWFEKFINDCYPKDFTTINGKKVKPPKYYDYLLEIRQPFLFEEIKIQRENREEENNAKKTTKDHLDELKYEKYRETVKIKQCKVLERTYENA